MSGLEIPKALTRSVEFTETGINIPANYKLSDLQQLTQLVAGIRDRSRWWLADCLNHGDHYGDEWVQWLDTLGLEFSYLRNLAWIGRRVAPAQRRAELSFTHHQEVAPFKPEEQEMWLQRAIDNGWTKAQLRRQIREANPYVSPQPVVATPIRGWRAAGYPPTEPGSYLIWIQGIAAVVPWDGQAWDGGIQPDYWSSVIPPQAS